MSKSHFCNTKNMHTVFNLKPTAENYSSVSKEGMVPLLDEQIFSPRVFPVSWGQAGTDLRAALLRLLGATSQGNWSVLRVPEEWPLVGGLPTSSVWGSGSATEKRRHLLSVPHHTVFQNIYTLSWLVGHTRTHLSTSSERTASSDVCVGTFPLSLTKMSSVFKISRTGPDNVRYVVLYDA